MKAKSFRMMTAAVAIVVIRDPVGLEDAATTETVVAVAHAGPSS